MMRRTAKIRVENQGSHRRQAVEHGSHRRQTVEYGSHRRQTVDATVNVFHRLAADGYENFATR